MGLFKEKYKTCQPRKVLVSRYALQEMPEEVLLAKSKWYQMEMLLCKEEWKSIYCDKSYENKQIDKSDKLLRKAANQTNTNERKNLNSSIK